jgi:hypothetical protein
MDLISEDVLGEIFFYATMRPLNGVYFIKQIRSIMLISKRKNLMKKFIYRWLSQDKISLLMFEGPHNAILCKTLKYCNARYISLQKSNQNTAVLELHERLSKMAEFLGWSFKVIKEKDRAEIIMISRKN